MKTEALQIKPLRWGVLKFKLTGTAPYCQARFSAKAINKIRETQEQGQRSAKGKAREARDFKADFEGAKHKFADGTCGIPASAFRAAMISACRVVGFKMTLAKLSIRIDADGLDAVDGLPLIRIKGEPEQNVMPVRNATGVCDLRSRPMWREWSAVITVRFDEQQFSASDVFNLLARVGEQVGIGEGRPDSRSSCGLGWGTFSVEPADH